MGLKPNIFSGGFALYNKLFRIRGFSPFWGLLSTGNAHFLFWCLWRNFGKYFKFWGDFAPSNEHF
jgi:hypothetical protein